jgi:hypothetical protein
VRTSAKVGITALALTAALALPACGHRSVDIGAVGGEPIPGAGALHVFCDRFGTLIYFTKVPNSTEDSYEAFFAQACVPGTRPIVSTLQIAPQAVQVPEPDYWRPDGDLENTQPGIQEDN